MLIPPWVYAAGAALTIAAGFGAGWTVRDWKADSDQLAAEQKADKLHDRLDATIADNATAYQRGADANRVAAGQDRNTIERIYRNVEVPADCAVPAAGVGVLEGARQRANAAASGESGGAVPGDRGPSDAVPGS